MYIPDYRCPPQPKWPIHIFLFTMLVLPIFFAVMLATTGPCAAAKPKKKPQPVAVTPRADDRPVYWKWPQPNADDHRRYSDGFDRWTTEWAKHRHDPTQHREPGPAPFPREWDEAGTEYDRIKYETMLEVHRFYADRINALEYRIEKLENKLSPPPADDNWPYVN